MSEKKEDTRVVAKHIGWGATAEEYKILSDAAEVAEKKAGYRLSWRELVLHMCATYMNVSK